MSPLKRKSLWKWMKMDEGNLEVKFPICQCPVVILSLPQCSQMTGSLQWSLCCPHCSERSRLVSAGTRVSPGGLHFELGVLLLLILRLRHRKLGFCAVVSLQREIQRGRDRHKCVPSIVVVFLLGEGHIKGQKLFFFFWFLLVISQSL